MFIDIDKKCPYCKNGVCTACKVLSISCDGRFYIYCEQYKISSMSGMSSQEAR